MGICKCDRCKREIGLNNDCTTPPDGFAILCNIKERNAVGGGFVGNNLGDCDNQYGKVNNIPYLSPKCLISARYLGSVYKKVLTQ